MVSCEFLINDKNKPKLNKKFLPIVFIVHVHSDEVLLIFESEEHLEKAQDVRGVPEQGVHFR